MNCYSTAAPFVKPHLQCFPSESTEIGIASFNAQEKSTSRFAIKRQAAIARAQNQCFFIFINLPLSLSPYFRKVSGFAGWQAPFMAQPAHPQPQDDFPFLLPRIILTRIAAATRTKTALMMIVAIFSINHASIEIPPVSLLQI